MGFSLSGFGDFVSSVGSNAVNAVTNSYFNRKAASKQMDYTKSLIDYENQYNLPVNQRARLEEAGYNPNLALNGVNVQSATGSAPQVRPAQIDLLQAYNLEAQNELLRKQMELTAKTQEKTDADINKVDAQTESQSIKNAKDRLELKFYEETGFDPDSWQGKAFKPIWNTGRSLGNSISPGAMHPVAWEKMMQRARDTYEKKYRKK